MTSCTVGDHLRVKCRRRGDAGRRRTRRRPAHPRDGRVDYIGLPSIGPVMSYALLSRAVSLPSLITSKKTVRLKIRGKSPPKPVYGLVRSSVPIMFPVSRLEVALAASVNV